MIQAFNQAVGPAHRSEHRRVVLLAAVAAVLQGICFALAVPVTDQLLGPEPASA